MSTDPFDLLSTFDPSDPYCVPFDDELPLDATTDVAPAAIAPEPSPESVKELPLDATAEMIATLVRRETATGKALPPGPIDADHAARLRSAWDEAVDQMEAAEAARDEQRRTARASFAAHRHAEDHGRAAALAHLPRRPRRPSHLAA